MSITNFATLFNVIDHKIKNIPITELKKIRSVLTKILVPMKIFYKGESDNYGTKNVIRFILNSDINKNNKLFNYVNGTVFQIYEHGGITKTKLLCIGFERHDKKIYNDIHHLIENHTYKIYKIIDGIKINMYYSEHLGKWVMSSKNAFDVGELVWRGYKYSDIIKDTLKKYNKFNVNKLNKKCSYSFIMNHPAYNMFNQPTIWKKEYFNFPHDHKFNKSMTLLGCNKIIGHDFTIQHMSNLFGIDTQKEYTINEILKCDKFDENVNFYVELFKSNENSIDNYIKSKSVNLGYILKSNNSTYNTMTMISALYNEIKKSIYDINVNIKNIAKTENIRYNKKFRMMENVIIYNWYTQRENIFIMLFPNYKSYFDKLNNIIDSVVLKYCKENVINMRNEDKTFIESLKQDENDVIVGYLHKKVLYHINKEFDYDNGISLENNFHIVKNKLRHHDLLDLYAEKIFNIESSK